MLPLFLSELAGGCLLMAAACRTDHVSWKYFRLIGFVSFGLIAAGLAFMLLGGPPTPSAGGAMAALLQPAAWFMLAAAGLIGVGLAVNAAQGDRPRAAQRWIALTAAGLTFAAGGALVRDLAFAVQPRAGLGLAAAGGSAWLPLVLVPLAGAVLAGAVLGGVTAAMLLGHAYLTQTAMPIDPLRRLTRLALAALLARGAWGVVGAIAAWDWLADPHGDVLWLWLMLSVRVGVGLVVGGVMLYMAADCVRLRNTQSATGILYIAMVMAFLGELAAIDLGRCFNVWV